MRKGAAQGWGTKDKGVYFGASDLAEAYRR